MKKAILFILMIVLALAGAGYAAAADEAPPPAVPIGPNTSLRVKSVRMTQHTVATLPSSPTTGDRVEVADGADASDCTVGGGASIVECRWSGAAWASTGDGVGAGTASGTVADLDGTGSAGVAETHSRGDHKHAVTPAGIGAQPADATLTDIADGTIAEDLVNTANPWAANEITEADPLALLTASTDNVKDTHIDWGSGAGQVDSSDIGAEPALGNPGTTGWVLSSTDAGIRSWVAQSTLSDLDDLPGDTVDDNLIDFALLAGVQAALTNPLVQADVDDTPVNGATTAPVSSNYVYDHVAAADPHTGYMLESNIGVGANNYLQLGATPGTPDGTKYLRDDLTWAVPPGGSGPTEGTLTDVSGTQVNVDLTEADDLTFGAAGGGSQTWTWDTGAVTDPSLTVSDDTFTFNKPITMGASATPGFDLLDSDNPGADKWTASFEAAYVDGADGSENSDVLIYTNQGGTKTLIAQFDESDDQWETTKAINSSGGFVGALTGNASTATAAAAQAITDNAIMTVDQADAADNDFAKFTAAGLEGRSYAETRQDLGLDTGDSPQFAGVNVGAAADTTITRVSAGVVAVEGVTVTRTIAAGTSALGTSEIASGACATAVTTAATGTATTDIIGWGFNGDPTAVTGYAPSANGMLTVISYPSADNVNFKVCNNTASAVTPGAITLNWKVVR